MALKQVVAQFDGRTEVPTFILHEWYNLSIHMLLVFWLILNTFEVLNISYINSDNVGQTFILAAILIVFFWSLVYLVMYANLLDPDRISSIKGAFKHVKVWMSATGINLALFLISKIPELRHRILFGIGVVILTLVAWLYQEFKKYDRSFEQELKQR